MEGLRWAPCTLLRSQANNVRTEDILPATNVHTADESPRVCRLPRGLLTEGRGLKFESRGSPLVGGLCCTDEFGHAYMFRPHLPEALGQGDSLIAPVLRHGIDPPSPNVAFISENWYSRTQMSGDIYETGIFAAINAVDDGILYVTKICNVACINTFNTSDIAIVAKTIPNTQKWCVSFDR